MSDRPAAPVLDGGQLAQLAELLAPQLVPQLADALAPELARAMRALPDPQPQRDEWLTTAEVADRFNLTIDFVYRHKDELGAQRLGTGPKARLRFRLRTVEEALSASVRGDGSGPAEAPPSAAKPPRRRRTTRAGADRVPDLLPIRGVEE